MTTVLFGFTLFVVQCGVPSNKTAFQPGPAFRDYWMQGKAELNRYELVQARYGELRNGHSVLVFVVENFRKDRQVKLEGPWYDGAAVVLKINRLDRFATGIYDYSLMSSGFTPLDGTPTIKTNVTVQDWCGHYFSQLNYRGGRYQAQWRSYFEQEGDGDSDVEQAFLEDEILNRIRMDPKTLPQGKIRIIASGSYSRLEHKSQLVLDAVARTSPYAGKRHLEANLQEYSVEMPAHARTVTFVFEGKAPYKVVGWEEVYESGWGAKAARLASYATLKSTVRIDYWNKHDNADLPLRDVMGLDRTNL